MSMIVVLAALAAVLLIALRLFSNLKASSVPVLSFEEGIFGTWKDSLRYLKDSPGVLQTGYEKFSRHGVIYRLPTPVRWFYVIPPKFIKTVQTAPTTHLSPSVAANDVVQPKHTISPVVAQDKFHFEIIKSKLTPSLNATSQDILHEIIAVFKDEIGDGTDWTAVPMSHAAHRIATRTANRLLVGLPLCRNEEYLDMSIRYTVDVFGGADKLRSYPEFLKPLMSKIVTGVAERQRIARKHLLPYILERLAAQQTYLEKPALKPSDALQWIIEAAPDERSKSPEALMYRMLSLNVSAVHTTSVTFLNCMFDLAYYKQYQQELRQEVLAALQDGAWDTKTLNSMKKLDSFMSESQRLSPIASSQMTRAVIQDFEFPDGTIVPKGSYILVPMHAMCLDDEIFPSAVEFDGFRYARMREQPGSEHLHQFTTTSEKHINFGHGKSACPGRFFASNEIKMLLAYTLLNYDVRLEDEAALPVATWYDRSRRPNLSAKVLYRKIATS